MQIAFGILFGVVIAVLAWRAGALTNSGAWAATLTGGVIFGFGGLPWTALLLTFFISSSALSRAFREQKTFLSEKFSKGSRRDWGQVLANGGLGTALVVVVAWKIGNGSNVLNWPWIAYAGAMAAVNADTWATEVGVLNPNPPRLITSGKTVEPGTSGAVSLYGMLASLAGSALIGLMASLFHPPEERLALIAGATLGGVIGSLFDSLLGATVQAIYTCPSCEKETERHKLHTCGTETRQLRGWRWLDNDMVNFLASLVGGLIAFVIWGLG